jgi:polysaccharide biosynthesis protein VpsJ
MATSDTTLETATSASPAGASQPFVKANVLPQLMGSAAAVQRWVEQRDYKGHEPFDGLSSPLRALTFRNLLAERILQQAVRQSPINIRPLLGIKPLESTKGRGMMAWGYLLLHRATGESTYWAKAVDCLKWLDVHKSPKFEKHSWANHFDFSSRGGAYYKHDSIIVWTSHIIETYLEAFEQSGDQWFLDIATSACEWIMALPREHTDRGDCISYFAHGQESIHNANMLGAAALARAARHTGRSDYADVARSAMVYSCTRMLPNGAWWYAEEEKFHWIDNFHTGYNLDCLKCYVEHSGDTEFAGLLVKGLKFYKENLFEASGCPKYYDSRTYPIDIQCASQSIDTLAYFAPDDPEALSLGVKVAGWTIRNMQGRSGAFYYRKYPGGITARTPMLHWGQATTFKALAHLILRLSPDSASRSDNAPKRAAAAGRR